MPPVVPDSLVNSVGSTSPGCQNGPVPLTIPHELLPTDGRFGAGPAKVRHDALDALATRGRSLLGTSHRQAPVKDLVASLQDGLRELYSLPDGYEVVLGNGGATFFWDIATFALVERRVSCGVFGEFSSKFATAATRAPWLDDAVVTEAPVGSAILPRAVPDADAYAWAHNETSTGALAPVHRVPDAAPSALVLVDGTSAAGGVAVDLSGVDAYYFAPQKAFSSDGGLWFALLSPAAVERAERLASDRWMPDSLNLAIAIANSRGHQTLNTPALATLFLMHEQVRWLLDHGGMRFAAARTAASAGHLYGWADRTPWASPFVADPALRSPVVGTIDFDDSVSAPDVCRALRANGIVDVEPYRKLGRNQVRVGMFPSVEPDDVAALTRCIDWVAERLSA